MKRRSLAPKEHGAYAQLGLPLLTALAGGRPTIAALSIALATIAALFLHEPVMVLLGRRGAAARRDEGTRAKRRVVMLTLAALALAWPITLSSAAIPAALALVVAIFVALDRERSTLGETVVAWCLASAAIPVALASGWSFHNAVAAALAWGIGLSAATIAVRGILASRKRGTPPSRTAAWVVLMPALAFIAPVPRWAVAASLPIVAVAIYVSLKPPHPRSLHALGWTLVGATVLTSAAILAAVH